MTDVEQQLLECAFLDRIRDLRFDDGEYAKLCRLLERLADEWRDARLIDKTVACELFMLPIMVRGASTKSSGPLAEKLRLIADELDARIGECLVGS